MEEIANLQHTTTKEIKDGITVHHLVHFKSLFLASQFKIDVYLPPDYDAGQSGHLPLLIFNDGQDMKQVRLTQTLHHLFLKEKIPSIMVVAIHAADRLQEYGVSGQPDYKGRGSRAGRYAKFITKELIPFVQHQYPCTLEAAKTAFAGFSLGGLSAINIVWNHPHLFQKVGVFSGALWWRHTEFIDGDPDAHRIMHETIQDDEHQQGLKFWFQTGTLDEKDDRNHNGIIDSIDDTLDLIEVLTNKGYTDKDIHYREVAGGIHHPSTWAHVLPEFLTWCFGRSSEK
jgi:enterochelin esterase-like enzyme